MPLAMLLPWRVITAFANEMLLIIAMEKQVFGANRLLGGIDENILLVIGAALYALVLIGVYSEIANGL